MMCRMAALRSARDRRLAAVAVTAATLLAGPVASSPPFQVALVRETVATVPSVVAGPFTASSPSAAAFTDSVGSAAPTAQEALARLPVKGRAPKTGYARSRFGDGWADTDNDGCSTREEILQRDLSHKTFRPSRPCPFVATGVLNDPYSGRSVAFRRGPKTSGLIQIDHVVALADAWRKGAQTLTPARRDAFANDPLNLLAVDAELNQLKSASDAASWLPPNKPYRCQYVARQVAVKATYGLWITTAEKAAIAGILATCPGQPLPTR